MPLLLVRRIHYLLIISLQATLVMVLSPPQSNRPFTNLQFTKNKLSTSRIKKPKANSLFVNYCLRSGIPLLLVRRIHYSLIICLQATLVKVLSPPQSNRHFTNLQFTKSKLSTSRIKNQRRIHNSLIICLRSGIPLLFV
jgi:hypothetical protein